MCFWIIVSVFGISLLGLMKICKTFSRAIAEYGGTGIYLKIITVVFDVYFKCGNCRRFKEVRGVYEKTTHVLHGGISKMFLPQAVIEVQSNFPMSHAVLSINSMMLSTDSWRACMITGLNVPWTAITSQITRIQQNNNHYFRLKKYYNIITL